MRFLPALAVALCGAMWGFFWYPLRWFDGEGIGAGWIGLVFNLVALASCLPWLLRRAAWDGARRQVLTGLLLGTAFSFYTVSLVLTDVIDAILLFYLTPVWSTLGGCVFLGHRLGLTRVFAIACGFAGLACILGPGGGLPVPRNAGDWLALASGILWSAGSLRSYRWPVAGIALPVFTFCAGGAVSAAFVLVVGTGLALPLAAIGNLAALLPWVVLLAFILFVPPNFLVLWATQRMDPGRVGILLMTEVLFGAISAALLSGEPFGALEFTGTALIVAAALVDVLGRR